MAIAIQSKLGSAYDLKPPTYDDDLVLVGKGTAGGEVLRRYWIPVALAAEVTDLPLGVRALGEDLVLFRTGGGEYGLVHARCCHRGTSLVYGKIHDDGISCCYHGWKFAPDGTCLEQPCEPKGSKPAKNLRQPWYPVQEQYGLVFAYMGPLEWLPPLPRYDVFEDIPETHELIADGNSIGSGGPERMPCNWFQTHENVMDPAHVMILHKDQFPPEMTQAFEQTAFAPSDSIIYGTASKTLPDGSIMRFSAELVFPNIRIIPDPFLTGIGRSGMIGWTLPIDDTNARIFTVMSMPKGMSRMSQMEMPAYNGKGWGEMTEAEHRRYPGDFEAQVSQGAITYHSEEHLVGSDRGVVMFRRMFREAIDAIRNGGNPPTGFGAPALDITVRAAFEIVAAAA